MSTRRVVVTGLGAVTPSGHNHEALWREIVSGHSAIDRLHGDEFADLPVRIGGQVRGFSADGLVTPALARRLSPVHLWAIAAADEALRGAHADTPPWRADRFGVIAATGSGPIDMMQSATRALDEGGPRKVPLALVVHGAPDSAAALISERYGALGPAHGVAATCASGAIGLGDALRRIRHGYADAVLVVGMEDCLNPVNLASNANLRALATGYENNPAAASRPFDRARGGFVMAQGAAALLLEAEDIAHARGAEPLAILAGFGESSDAHHPTAPHPEGRGAAQAITAALTDAGLKPAAIDHVNAHGTGTPAGDAAEIAALRTALGERAHAIPVTATKSSTGHLLGASGTVEAILAIQTLRTQTIPPTLNLDAPEFGDIDIVTGTARQHPVQAVLSNSFGFGGHNGALVFTRPDKEK